MLPIEDDTMLGPRAGRPWIATGWRRFLLGLRIAQARLRLVIVLVVAFAIVGQWHVIRNYWDKWTGSAGGPATAAISSDTEYFCPMDPGVISAWPTKCSICNMALVRRHKGEVAILPDGVVARMQLSPYRLQLAGIETSPIDFLPLAREVEARGTVVEGTSGAESSRIEVEAQIRARDVPYVFVGQEVEVTGDPAGGKPAMVGKIVSLAPRLSTGRTRSARLEVDHPSQELLPGMNVRMTARVPLDEVEPMRSQPTNPPPPAPHDVRRIHVCPDHPHVLEIRAGTCPLDNNELVERPLAAHQRLSWWCPMHPQVTAGEAGKACAECQGMELAPRVISYRPPGQVLAVPETAVVDTGARQVVYVETAPGMFDGVEVALAERSGGYYPVISGLEAGQRVATAGAFLIDAETRLNPSLATAYFGAARGQSPAGAAPAARLSNEAEEIRQALAELGPADQAMARSQAVCPVTGLKLGSMGPPPAVTVAGERVLICCQSCEAALNADPQKYLAKRAGGKAGGEPAETASP